jgi:cGMP-dependent protein kinase
MNPENVMIDSDGYIKLIELGCAKKIKDRTYTFLGTPHYAAPEVVSGQGYGFSSDFWSLGTCLYELLTGKLPFAAHDVKRLNCSGVGGDPFAVYKEIKDKKLQFDYVLKDAHAKDIIEKLLDKNPEKRLTSLSKIKKHPWLADFDMVRDFNIIHRMG